MSDISFFLLRRRLLNSKIENYKKDSSNAVQKQNEAENILRQRLTDAMEQRDKYYSQYQTSKKIIDTLSKQVTGLSNG